MKKIFTFLAAFVVAFVALVMPAAADSFNVTNWFTNTVVYVGYPTNTMNTNGMGRQNGGPINIGNVYQASFYYTARPVINGGGTTQLVSMITSPFTGYPTVVTDTNDSSIFFNPWCLSNQISFSFVVPAGTNAFCFSTNLGEGFLAGQNWIGIWQITNVGTEVFWYTNVDYGITKKTPRFTWP